MKCAWCNEVRVLGKEVAPYSPAPKTIRWLCQPFTGRDCKDRWYAKLAAHKAEQAAKIEDRNKIIQNLKAKLAE